MTSRSDLAQAYWDNVRHNQIGGETDGISPEVAADLGYQTVEQTTELIRSLPADVSAIHSGRMLTAQERRDLVPEVRDAKNKLPPSPDLSW